MNGDDELKKRESGEKMESKKTPTNVRVKKWRGWCESVGRVLIVKIEEAGR